MRMSWVRIRVARSDWWASRIVVSVTRTRVSPRIHSATASGPFASRRALGPSDRTPPGSGPGPGPGPAGRARGLRVGGRPGASRHLRMAVDGDLGDVAEQPARPIARAREGQQRRVVVDEAGRDPAVPERLVADEALEERDVGRDPPDPELPEGAPHAADRARPGGRPHGDLLEERVVVPGDDRARVGGPAVEADPEPGRHAVGGDPAVVGDEAVEGVLGRDPALHRVPPEHDVLLRRAGGVRPVPDVRSLRDADLGPDEVHPGHLLGHGVLDLDAGVHLDEVEAAGVLVVQELHRPRVEVVRLARDGERVADKLLALRRAEPGGRGALHDLLVAPLHRAVALEEMDDAAVRVGEHLDLEVPGPPDEPLEVDVVLAEGGGRLAPRREEGRLEGVRTLDDPHPAPAPAPARLEDPGEADLAGTTSRAAAGSAGRASVAGTVGTPAAAAMARAETLSPSRRRVSGRGPMNATPAAAHASANSGDSDRNP